MSDTRETNPLMLHQVMAEEYEKILAKNSSDKVLFPEESSNAEKLAIVFRRFHEKKPSALCLSGGGIRSATFGLGVVQGLARYGLLDKFDYLSTVSGGGYIGSWLTAWIHREQLANVSDQLCGPGKGSSTQAMADMGAPGEIAGPEPMPIVRLRQYSNYLTPRIGLLSADTWTWAGIYLRNLILNWLVLIPLTAAALAIPKMGVPITQLDEHFGLRWVFLGGGLALTAWAIAYVGLNLPSSQSGRRGWLAQCMQSHRDQKGFLIWCWTPLLIGSVALTTFWAWFWNAGSPMPEWTTFVAVGIVIHCIGWLPFLVSQRSPLIRKFRQLAAIVAAGAAGGLLVWWPLTFIPRFGASTDIAMFYVCFAAPALLTVFLMAKTWFVGLFSRYSDDDDREWSARAGGWLLIAILTWSITSALVMFGPEILAKTPSFIASLGGVAGIITIVLGHSAHTPANIKEQAELIGKLGQTVNFKNMLLKSAAPFFAAFLISLISLGADWAVGMIPAAACTAESVNCPYVSYFWRIAGFALVMLVFGIGMGFFINVNKFSLHAAYRNRLIRAYLGAARKKRDPNLFTGLDPADNIQMHSLDAQKPFHVVNMALNLVRGSNLAWQQRKAESFTVSPLHAGACRMKVGEGCYRPSRQYGKGDRGESITLGTAIAISGAAASPNMGYHSSPGITFLMTLFNARLGWWLGNPGRNTFDRAYPRFAIGPLLAETFGLTDDDSDYIYASDGGHFENLGLYEMVLRRCHFIVVSDAGQDACCTFEDLGNAIRKIRVDFGIPIEMQEVCIYPRNRKEQGKCCAIGRIHYSCLDDDVEDGYLLYLKPTFYGNEPMDIYQYAQTSEAFPHEPTSDQWFSESQFESYRMLGLNTVRTIVEQVSENEKTDQQPPMINLDELYRRAQIYLRAPRKNSESDCHRAAK